MLEFVGGLQSQFSATDFSVDFVFLSFDPVTEVAVSQSLQDFVTTWASKFVIVDQSMKSVALASVPDVPNKRTLIEQFAMLFEESVAKPIVQVFVR